MFVTQICDYKKFENKLTQFYLYANWATWFTLTKCFENTKQNWCGCWKIGCSNDTYTIRYGIGVLLRLYLDEDFKDEYPKLVSAVISDEYYVNMMIAWYFATALAKQWEAVIGYLKDRKLPEWVHRKTIQKAIEAIRITEEQKAKLRGLRWNVSSTLTS